jgi:uncharacterized protein
MKCPTDDTPLVMTDRQGIEIDYCPQCRGVWLDRGELDKLIERSVIGASGNVAPSGQPRSDTPRYDDRERYEHNENNHPPKKHKKESFLGDFFDF